MHQVLIGKKEKKEMKEAFCTAVGILGGSIVSLLGGWSQGLATLIIFMAIDYISGMVVAGVFKKSPKTETGALESNICYKGLIRKAGMMAIVIIAYRLDIMAGSTYIRDMAIIALIASESISIIENLGLMGVPIPNIIINAIDLLKKKGDEANGNH